MESGVPLKQLRHYERWRVAAPAVLPVCAASVRRDDVPGHGDPFDQHLGQVSPPRANASRPAKHCCFVDTWPSPCPFDPRPYGAIDSRLDISVQEFS